jgi:hypothetical protein
MKQESQISGLGIIKAIANSVHGIGTVIFAVLTEYQLIGVAQPN